MLILENAVLRRLASNAALVTEFPFIAQAGVGSAGCGCQNKDRPDFNALRATLVALGPEQRARFKALVGDPSVRVVQRIERQTVITDL